MKEDPKQIRFRSPWWPEGDACHSPDSLAGHSVLGTRPTGIHGAGTRVGLARGRGGPGQGTVFLGLFTSRDDGPAGYGSDGRSYAPVISHLSSLGIQR